MVICDTCERTVLANRVETCGYCKRSKYCSSECMVLGTRRHNACPLPETFRSVDYLYIDVFDNEFPTNEKTIKDYGFANCKLQEERINLLGLYIGLLKILNVKRTVLHEFCMKDKIGDLIKKEFENYPADLRGDYYLWFLDHQHIVKNGNKVDIEKLPANLENPPQTSKKNARSSANYSFEDGRNIINYGYNGEMLYYYLNVQDSRMAWRSGMTDGVEKVINDVDSSGEGILFQLHTGSSPTIRGHQVSVETLAEFFKRYHIRNSHIDKMKLGKLF